MKKLSKRVLIAKSGIYEYRLQELPYLGLDIESGIVHKEVYKVYRPAIVLAESLDKFTKLPLLIKVDLFNHPDDFDDQANWDKYGIGWTGDTSTIQLDQTDGEAALYSTVNIVGQQGIDAYNMGIIEVSPGYYGTFVWREGLTPTGEDYDIIMTNIQKVDHLLVTTKARGGHDCKIFDATGGKPMFEILTGLLWQVKKALHKLGVGDSGTRSFREIVTDTIKNRAAIGDSELVTTTTTLKQHIADLPDGSDKELLGKYIDELPVLKQKPDDLATAAGDQIASLYERLDSAAMADKPSAVTEPQTTPTQTGDAGSAYEGKETPEEEKKEEELKKKEEGKAKDTSLPPEPVPNVPMNPSASSGDTEGGTDAILEQMFQLLSKWKSGKGTTDSTTTVKNTDIKSNQLEDFVSGPDKVLPLSEKEDKGTGDADIVSPILDTSTSDGTGGLTDLFNKF
jgi:hypothetical protein